MESAADLQQLAGYTEVTGMLEISGSEDLVCLDPLACLEVVGRDLRVQENAALRSTTGLSNLRILGAAYESPRVGRPALFVGKNAVLETFEGFALEGYVHHLVIWQNPALADVSDLRFEHLETLSVLGNPQLEALSSLDDLSQTRCFINHNPLLCSAELQSVCTKPDEHSQVYNGVDCPEGAPEPIEPWSQDDECSPQTQDCPPGEKCTPWFFTDLVCRDVVSESRSVGEPCTPFDIQDGLDDCERHAVCREGSCWAMAFGILGSLVCPRSDEYPIYDGEDVERYCAPACDPLADECRGDQVCAPYNLNGQGLTCRAPSPQSPGALGGLCSTNSCGKGLACVGAQWSSACDPDLGSCCLPFCDIGAPDCPAGSTCVSWWDEDHDPLPKLEHVGFCAEL